MNRFTIALLLFAIQTSPAYSAENCSDIEDPAARLKCFDRNFPHATSPVPITPQVKKKKDSVADDVLSDDILGPIPVDESIETGAVVVIESENAPKEIDTPTSNIK